MKSHRLIALEKKAAAEGLLLRIQVRRPLNLWAFKLSVAKLIDSDKVKILGEMKGWAYNRTNGLQLDTMQVRKNSPKGIGHLVWASTMAWALEETYCRKARLLAIYDESNQHLRLTHYFSRRGFKTVKDVGSSLLDLPLRIVWGGSGSLMVADCSKVYKTSLKLWETSIKQ